MKKFIKILLIIVSVVLLIAVSGISYLKFMLPSIALEDDLVIESTPERLERGHYLANYVMGCLDCHAERDMSYFAGKFIPESRGTGGERWTREMGFPGNLTSLNITPYSLGDWSDAELFRAITTGVSKDGRALMPIMPYHQYGRLPQEDIYAVIAYIKSLEPKEKDHPEPELDFPISLIVNSIPAKGTHDLAPNPDDPIAHGKYMLTASVCYDCHTPMEKGQFIDELAFAGGNVYPLPTGGSVTSMNITPDKETGIGNWTREQFIHRFTSFRDSVYTPRKVASNEFNTIMPWTYYANMKDEDLGAIYDYLMSLDPIKNELVRFEASGSDQGN